MSMAKATLTRGTTTDTVAHKRQANVRFDAHTRSALEHLALETDRTLSQLVRYAVSWWLAEGGITCPAPADTDETRHVNVRFDQALLDGLTTRCEQTGSDRSTLVRCAVSSWLRHVHHEPASATGPVGLTGLLPSPFLAAKAAV